jgi:hypothetical protein
VYVDGKWGNCLDSALELVPREKQTYSGENTCTDNYHHICAAESNYGGISVDWDTGEVTLAVYTPHEDGKVASSIVISL